MCRYRRKYYSNYGYGGGYGYNRYNYGSYGYNRYNYGSYGYNAYGENEGQYPENYFDCYTVRSPGYYGSNPYSQERYAREGGYDQGRYNTGMGTGCVQYLSYSNNVSWRPKRRNWATFFVILGVIVIFILASCLIAKLYFSGEKEDPKEASAVTVTEELPSDHIQIIE